MLSLYPPIKTSEHRPRSNTMGQSVSNMSTAQINDRAKKEGEKERDKYWSWWMGGCPIEARVKGRKPWVPWASSLSGSEGK